ncbi:S8 family serine peptidase [Mesonia sp.]|uniref:S8 family serine peptidase n=1 Tax=Mesonia sp. TaxID=1960830 RepID=UPI0017594393|nr:S8 family serine peptidase [Mesonia sp.]HIB37022.1 T9SS type A sorting domain-containing protein [Mesonia sp.]HIO27397.1 T9SS type A sorting domain-containing protein [Flavobacteriaceae bacterium]
MKKLILFVLVSCTLNLYSQTKEEKQKILNSFDNEAKSTVSFINERETEINNQIKELLLKGYPEEIVSNGKLFKLRRVTLNNTPIYFTLDNADAAESTRTNFLHTGGGLGLNINGENMNIATWDGGPTLVTHNEFQSGGSSRIVTPDASSSNDQSLHSTHVSGTIVAQGLNIQAKGMAPEAFLKSFDWDNDESEVLNEALNEALLISNHSYGVPIFNSDGGMNVPTWYPGCYNSDARAWDVISAAAPYYLMVASAGNEGSATYSGGLANGYDKLTGNKVSKNNLVVANAQDAFINPNGSGDLLGTLFINSSSSQGPTDDGRVKPDITGNGTGVFSTSNTSNSTYATLTGTSMSAPNVSGSLLLLQQYYNTVYSNYMKAATLKGLACHTADDAGNAGPDPIFGWGLLNSKLAAETIENSNIDTNAIISELNLQQGSDYNLTVFTDGIENLKATIVWTDPAGTAKDGQLNSPVAALVNDLDIRILDLSGNTYLPYKLNLSNVAGAATKGDNTVDNVEQVEIEFPIAGEYEIQISHKGNIQGGSQDYSLIVTGITDYLNTKDVEFQNTLIRLWPNPAKETINLSSDSSVDLTDWNINLYDLQGRLIIKNIKSQQIDISTLNSGVYVLDFKNGNQSFQKKVIKE